MLMLNMTLACTTRLMLKRVTPPINMKMGLEKQLSQHDQEQHLPGQHTIYVLNF